MKKIIIKLTGFYFNLGTHLFPKLVREQAFRLLGRVNRLPIAPEGETFFKSGTTSFTEVNGCRTALHRWGRGPKTILFLHGWMSHSERWKDYIEALDKELYSCYALDAPGHGNSEGNYLNLEVFRQAYAQALDSIGEVDIVVAHSFGNMAAAYQYLFDSSVKVNSYVIMGSPSGMDAIYEYFRDMLGLSSAMIKNLDIKVRDVLKVGPERLQLSEFFSENPQPKLVIHEFTDSITPIGPIRRGIEGLPNITSYFTNGLDHTLKGKEVLNLVVEFIENMTKEKVNVPKRV